MKSILQSKIFYVLASIFAVALLSVNSFAQREKVTVDGSRSVRSRADQPKKQTPKDEQQPADQQFRLLGAFRVTTGEVKQDDFAKFNAIVDSESCYHRLKDYEFAQAYFILDRVPAAKAKYSDGLALALRRARIIPGKENSYADVLVADLNIDRKEAEKIDRETKKEAESQKRGK